MSASISDCPSTKGVYLPYKLYLVYLWFHQLDGCYFNLLIVLKFENLIFLNTIFFQNGKFKNNFFFSLTGTVLAFKGFPTTFSGCQNMPEVRFYLTHFFQYKTYQEFLKLSSPSNGLQPYTLFFQFNFLYFK